MIITSIVFTDCTSPLRQALLLLVLSLAVTLTLPEKGDFFFLFTNEALEAHRHK